MIPDACAHWALAQQPSVVAKLHVWMVGLRLVRLRSRVVMAVAVCPLVMWELVRWGSEWKVKVVVVVVVLWVVE